MKITLALCAAAALALAGCEEKPADTSAATTPEAETAQTAELTLDARCDILAADPEAQENITEMGTDTDGFCDCFVSYIDAQSTDDQQAMKVALARVTDAMDETGTGAEEVVSLLMREVMFQSSQEGEMTELGEGINLIGQAIDDIDSGFEDTGACPVS